LNAAGPAGAATGAIPIWGGGAVRPLAILVAVFAPLLVAVWWAHIVGAVPVGLYTSDYEFLAEGARRIALGQRPHLDFFSPIGPLTLWLIALARQTPWLGPDAFAMNALAWAFFAAPIAAVALRVRSTAQTALFVGVAALVTLSPFTLEVVTDACGVNYNGIYNRYGAALLFAAMVAGFCPSGSSWSQACVLAWLLGAMLLVKITYALAGFAFLGLACVFSAERARALGIALALLTALLGALELATGVPLAYARDLAEMARLNGAAVPALLSIALGAYPLSLALGLALAIVLGAEAGGPLDPPRRATRALLEAAALAMACVVLVFWTESQSTGGAGLIGLTALLFAPAARTRRWVGLKLVLGAALVAATVGAFGEQVFRRGRCVAAEAPDLRSRPALAAISPRLMTTDGLFAQGEFAARFWRDEKPFADEAYRRHASFGIESYGSRLGFVASALVADEAVARLRQLGLDRGLRHVTSLTFQDEITPVLGTEPAQGLKLVLDPFRTVGPLTAAKASAYLGPVDAVFERTCAVTSWTQWLADTFRPALTDFDATPLTPCWTVHIRRKG
jgi:hypothetical protein